MKHPILLLGFLGLLAGKGSAQKIDIVDFSALKASYDRNNDTTYVVNFWATWCSPCIEELPYFEEARVRFRDQKVQFLLVSVDFRSQLESKVKPFVRQQDLKSNVVFLNETDANRYINAVDPAWSGAIPATLLVNKKRKVRVFKEASFARQELFDEIQKTLK